MSAQVRRRDPFILAGPPFRGYCLPGNPRAKLAQTTDPWKWARDRAAFQSNERARRLSAILPLSTRRKRTPMNPQTGGLVDLRGIEPLTSSMPRKRAPAAPQARSPLIVPEGGSARRYLTVDRSGRGLNQTGTPPGCARARL